MAKIILKLALFLFLFINEDICKGSRFAIKADKLSSSTKNEKDIVYTVKEEDIRRGNIFNDTFAFEKQGSLGVISKISDLRAEESVNRSYKSFDDFDFVKQDSDRNKYSFVTLDNDIQVFLVSHYSALSPTISVVVRAGSSMEEDGFPGIASLLSEIMFYNWRKESETQKDSFYARYISNNNGRFEIDVGSFRTEYRMSVKSEHFEEALMNFGQTFKSPNLNRLYLEPSLDRLQSNFESIRENYDERLKQIFKDVSNKSHPNYGFRFGLRETLTGNSDKDYERLIFEVVKFHNAYYSSNMMSICIVSDKSIEELKNYAVTYFDEIPNFKSRLVTPFHLSGNATHPHLDLRQKIIQIKSSSEMPYLTLVFPIPHQTVFWKFKPTEYISFFMSNYSESSLFGYLKKSGYIDDIATKTEINDNGFSNFVIKYTLSNKSDKNILRIVEMTLSFIKLVREVPISDAIIDQVRRKRQTLLAKKGGIFKEDVHADIAGGAAGSRDTQEHSYAERRSRMILDSYVTNNCSPIDVLRTSTCMNKIDFKYVVDLLGYIGYENMIVLLEKREFKKSGSDLLLSNSDYYDGRLKRLRNSLSAFFRPVKSRFNASLVGVYPNFLSSSYFGTKYTVENIPVSILARLSTLNSTLAHVVGKLQMPTLDQSYPSNVQVYTKDIKTKEFPSNLYSELKLINGTVGIDGHFVDKNATLLSSIYYIESPIELSDLSVALNNSKLSYFTKKTCYFPTKYGSDMLIFARLHIPDNISRDTVNYPFNKTIERLTVTFYLYQYCLKKLLSSTNLTHVFRFKEEYTLWEMQEFFYGLEFVWRGFTAVFPDVMNEISKSLVEFDKHLKQSLLIEAKNRFKDVIEKFKTENENQKVAAISYELLDPGFLGISKLENELQNIDLQMLIKFSRFFSLNFGFSGSIFGNVTPIQAKYYLTRFIRTTRQVSSDLFSLQLENSVGTIQKDIESRDGTFILLNYNRSTSEESELRKLRASRDGKSKSVTSSNKNTTTLGTTGNTTIESSLVGVHKQGMNETDLALLNATERVNNLENRIYVRSGSYNDVNRLPYNYSSSYFYCENIDKNSRLNIVLLQVHVGYYSEASYVMLQVVSELNSYKYFLEFSKNRCSDCSLTILPRIILSKYMVLQFKLQSSTENTKELSELLNEFYQEYYSRPTKMVSKPEVKRAISFIRNISRSRLSNLESFINSDFSFDFQNSEDLSSLSSYHLNVLKHLQGSCDWRKDYNEFLFDLGYERFFAFWRYLATSSRILISYQSHSTNSEILEYIESYVPRGFTRVSSIDGLYEINEQQLNYPS